MDRVPGAIWRFVSKGFSADFKSRNWSVYGQWLGLACFVLDIVLGVVNLLHLGLIIIFGVIAIVQGLLILFLEANFLLRICPVTDRFGEFIRKFQSNLPRAAFYIFMAAIQFGGLALSVTSLLACALVMLAASVCYFIGYFTNQEFIASKTLGGEGVAQEMIA